MLQLFFNGSLAGFPERRQQYPEDAAVMLWTAFEQDDERWNADA
jgi:hypothetical protein